MSTNISMNKEHLNCLIHFFHPLLESTKLLRAFLSYGIKDNILKVEDDPISEFLGYLISTSHSFIFYTV